MLKPISHLLHSFLLLVLIGTFTSIVYYIRNEPHVSAAPALIVPSIIVTPTPVPTVSDTVESIPEVGWSLIQPGLERRVMDIYNEHNQLVESLHIWRLDQTSFRLDVAYDSSPKTLDAWQSKTNAAMVINGGYYSIANEKYFPDGLTIVNGQASGRSFNRSGGMLAILDDRAELRWLAQEPYNPSESLRAALQSFPVLVQPGGQLGYGADKESHAQARRTVIAQDRAGRILLMVAPQGHFTLHQLSLYLTQSDLNLDIAINLDGGGSTG
ncbi:MAG TPA: phosphodiester glycosidase family protein, partial [Anaerolineales bacterium]|nr:phosphodiester glycosidase family protein [Anaerolineales bacterium]